MSRIDGKKIVGIAFLGITGAIGMAQIYLPYYADRDKLRGLFEEEDMPTQAKHEMDMMMRAEQARMEAEQQSQQRKSGSGGGGDTNGGSMWKNLRRN